MTKVRFREVVAFVWRYWRQFPLLVSGLVVGMLAATVCDVFLPVLTGRLIDALTGDLDAPGGGLTGALWAVGAFVGLTAAFHACREASYRLWLHLATRVMRRILTDAFNRVQRFSADWHANSFAGSTVRKISRGMWAYDAFADTVYIGFFPAACVVAGITTILFIRWPIMGGYVLAAVILYVTISVILATRYVAPANEVMNEVDSEVGGAMADAISCNEAVKSFGAEAREDRRFFAIAERWRTSALKSWSREMNVSITQSTLTTLLQLGLLLLALWYWSRGLATPGDVAFVLTSYFLVNGYLREVGRYVRDLQQAINELEDLIRFDRQPLGVADRPDAKPLRAERGEIRFDRVTFRYGNQPAPIYQDFSLTIAPGEKVALVGPSGSGKSTFVKLVQRLYDIDGGRILIDGQDVAAATQESVRQALSLVPQDPCCSTARWPRTSPMRARMPASPRSSGPLGAPRPRTSSSV